MSQTQPLVAAEYICSCFFTGQIFVKKYGLHVTFDNESQFGKDFRQSLRLRGCSTDSQYSKVLSEIKAEKDRREAYHATFLANYLRNQESYTYIHPELKHLQPSFFDQNFLKIVEEKNLQHPDTLSQAIAANGGFSHGQHVYSFPLFTEEFCSQLVEESLNFQQSTRERSLPNTMNFEGVSLDEMGLSQTLLTALIETYFQAITSVLYPTWGGGATDSFKSFIVHYSRDKQPGLAKHFDNAEVSMSICLKSGFVGGELQLGQLHGEEEESNPSEEAVVVPQRIGYCILHRSRQLHFAHPVTSGVRTNLIVWMRSSSIRNRMCPMCGCKPSIMEVPIAGDGFTLADSNVSNSSCTCS